MTLQKHDRSVLIMVLEEHEHGNNRSCAMDSLWTEKKSLTRGVKQHMTLSENLLQSDSHRLICCPNDLNTKHDVVIIQISALASQHPTSSVNGSVCLSEVRLMRVCTEHMNYSSTPRHLCRVEKNNYCSDATHLFSLPPANSCTREHTSARVVLL